MKRLYATAVLVLLLILPVTASTAPKPHAHHLGVEVFFTPAVVPGDYYVSMWAQTHPGATCYGKVVYSTGYQRYSSGPRTADQNGRAWWQWHDETGHSGKGTVSCTWRSETRQDTDRFTTSSNP